MTREEWLNKATEELRANLFGKVGYKVPEVKVSIGFPKGRGGAKNKIIGQCWSAECASDKVAQIFISPELGEPTRVLDVLVHELVHATIGTHEGHNKAFKRCAESVGLTGKMTATVAGEVLKMYLTELSDKLGEFPHAELMASIGGGKKQGTRLIKACCAECGYTVRVTRQWLAVGAPLCPCNGEEMEVEA